jgi:general secretion pathway protein K
MMLKPFQNQKGLALLLVLLVITLLVAIVVEFDYRTRIDLRSAGNLRDGLQATYLAKSGVAAAQAILKDDKKRNANTTDLTATWAIPLPPLPVGEGTASLRITDEASKFNLNNLVSKTNHQKVPSSVAQARKLFELVQVDPNLVDSIVDWVDTDDNPEPSGAEESYYQSLLKPYHCKNKSIDLLSELHLIKGITDEVYKKISPYLTVSSSGPTNINTADSIVLQALFPDEALVKKLIENRPIKTVADLRGLFGEPVYSNVVLPLMNPQYLLLTAKSDVFSVEAQGRAHDTVKTVRALIERQSTGVVRVKTWRME